MSNEIKLFTYEMELVLKGVRQCITVVALNKESAIVYACEKYDIYRDQITECIRL